MKNKLLVALTFTILITIFMSGCQEETNDNQEGTKVLLDSDLVGLIYSNYSKEPVDDLITIRVEYKFKNLLNKYLDINISAEFYDEDDNLLETVGTNRIKLNPLYEETGIDPSNNVITYNGIKASDVDYVRLIVEENN